MKYFLHTHTNTECCPVDTNVGKMAQCLTHTHTHTERERDKASTITAQAANPIEESKHSARAKTLLIRQ